MKWKSDHFLRNDVLSHEMSLIQLTIFNFIKGILHHCRLMLALVLKVMSS